MSMVDVKDLIDIPGAGRAEVALRAIGAWDDERAPGAVEWDVTVFATMEAVQTMTVRALTEAEAKKLVAAKAMDRDRWDISSWDPNVHTVLAVEIAR